MLTIVSHGQSMVDEYETALDSAKKLETKMNKIYANALASYSGLKKTLFMNEQTAWVKYRQAQLKISEHVFRGGSGQGLEVLTRKIELTDERIRRLEFLKGYL